MKVIVVVVCALCLSSSAFAQFGNLLEKGLSKGEKFAKKKGTQLADQERDKLDSTDFNYAISVIDNAGIMNIKDTKEKALKTYSMYQSVDNDKRTPAQKSRDILDFAEKMYESKRYRIAEGYFIAAKLSYETEKLTDNINYSKAVADLGLLYSTMGRYSVAEPFITDALDIRSQSLGENSRAYASSLNNRAVLYQETARYSESEADFIKAADLTKKIIGEKSGEYATVLNNQAILFARIGRTDDAVANLNKATAIMDNQVGFKSNLALLYQQTGKYAEAEAIYLNLQKKLTSDNPYYAGVLNSLALLYIQMNKPEKVEDLLKKSRDVYKAKLGEETPNYAKVTNDLGNFYRRQGRFDEAEATLLRALAIREKVLSTTHPDYATSQEDLGILYWKKGDLDKAYPYFSAALDQSLNFINQYFPPMSEAEKSKYWDILFPRFQCFNNYAADAASKKPELTSDMYNYQIATKALLLSSTNKIKKTILSSKDDALIKDYITWLDQKETLARLYAYSREELKEQKVNLDSMERATNAMEKSLSQRSKDFSEGYTTEKVTYKEIAAGLADAEEAVEIIRIRTFDKDFTNDARYAALVITKASPQPKLVMLDNGAQLDTRYYKFYRNSIMQKSVDEMSYAQFWERLEPLVSAKKIMYFSPDGIYNQINVNTLKKKDGDYVLNRYDITIVGNTKDLIAIKTKKAPTPKKDAFLLGFPDYGGNAVPALPGTKVEIEGLNRILKANGYQTTQLVQANASEKNLKAVKGPSIIHIATHGYFLPDNDSEEHVVGVSAENAKNNPLLRSGLLLANASPTVSGKSTPNLESNDNGVLTAYEAMNLNLEGTDLIILSACETGLGEVKSGEGVYGLQRAFQVAGAKALVMSLWKVDDAATQQLMTAFYSNLVKGGSRAKAFKQAQLQLMTKYKEPYYWGAFVMMGM